MNGVVNGSGDRTQGLVFFQFGVPVLSSFFVTPHKLLWIPHLHSQICRFVLFVKSWDNHRNFLSLRANLSLAFFTCVIFFTPRLIMASDGERGNPSPVVAKDNSVAAECDGSPRFVSNFRCFLARDDGNYFVHYVNFSFMKSLMTAVCLSVFFLPSLAIAADSPSLLPDKNLTPGQVRTIDTKVICESGYSKRVRNTSAKLKQRIYMKYRVTDKERRTVDGKLRYKIDHLIPLSIGGEDGAKNLWPVPLFTQPMNGYDKDRLEFRLYQKVCHEGYDVKVAQKQIRTNWIMAYEKHCPTPESCPSFVDYMESIGQPVR